MRNIWVFAKREYWHYFVSPIAYAVSATFLLLIGAIFVATALSAASSGSPPSMGATFNWFFIFFTLLSPAFTMRLLADEQRTGTLELLLTGPVREWELVIGKWLGAWLFIMTLLAITGIYPLILNMYSNPGQGPDMGPIWSSYLGLALSFGAFLAVGVLASAVTANLVVAVVLAFGAALGVWAFGALSFILTQFAQASSSDAISKAEAVINYLDFLDHNSAFTQGTINTSDIVYYVSAAALMLYLATRVVEMRRWR